VQKTVVGAVIDVDLVVLISREHVVVVSGFRHAIVRTTYEPVPGRQVIIFDDPMIVGSDFQVFSGGI
jgi:orotate phosphoribosyltransferase-like protein